MIIEKFDVAENMEVPESILLTYYTKVSLSTEVLTSRGCVFYILNVINENRVYRGIPLLKISYAAVSYIHRAYGTRLQYVR